MPYDQSELQWLELRAVEIAKARGWPLPIAMSEAPLKANWLFGNPVPADEAGFS